MEPNRPLTISEIRARRENGRRSKGPRTREGRRRASLNWRRLELPRAAYAQLKRLQVGPEGFMRLWRDLLSIFWFLEAELEGFINYLAWDWWLKQYHAERSAPEHVLRIIDVRIENSLGVMIRGCAMVNRKWRVQFQREIGTTGEHSLAVLRLAVEARLPGYRALEAAGKLPPVRRLELAVIELEQVLEELKRAI